MDWAACPAPDPYEDQFNKRTKEKAERVAKNKANQQRNVSRAAKGAAGPATPVAPALPGVPPPQVMAKLPATMAKLAVARAVDKATHGEPVSGKNPFREVRKRELKENLTTTRTATASYGRFDAPIRNEPRLPQHAKRHFEPLTAQLSQQRLHALELATKVASKITKAAAPVNARKAANMVQHSDEAERRRRKASGSPAGKSSGKSSGKGFSSKGSSKGFSKGGAKGSSKGGSKGFSKGGSKGKGGR